MKDRDTLYPRVCEINDSTNILEIAYDPLDKVMRITFKKNVRYIYENVSNYTFGNIISADSTGEIFNEYVKFEKLLGVKVDD